MRIRDWSSDVCSADLVEDEASTVRRRAGLHALQVGTGARLGHADRADAFTTCHLRQIFLLLRFAAKVQDVWCGDIRMHRKVRCEREKAYRRDFLDDDPRERERRADAAVCLGLVAAPQARFPHLQIECLGNAAALSTLLVLSPALGGAQ